MTKNNPILCLGIDPNPTQFSFEKFKISLENHIQSLELIQSSLHDKRLKVNLAFFLAHGSKGIALLEEFCAKFKDEFTIILDGKFNEISNSLKAYLHFVYDTLKVHGMTINPFLGENTLRMAFEMCVSHAGEKGRIYVLCVTSENSNSTLAYLQENWRNKLLACQQIRDEVFANQENLKKCAGVVIGANKENILFSKEVKESKLSILSPGLGTQGGDYSILNKCFSFSNEFTFPMSRSLFEAGEATPRQAKINLLKIQPYFEESHGKH